MARIELQLSQQDFDDLWLVVDASKGLIKVQRDIIMTLLMDHSRVLKALSDRHVEVTTVDPTQKPKLHRAARSS
jgi:hypothetical protein